MSWHNFDYADLPVTPWKNGGGSTVEVARWPTDCGLEDFIWRVSIAAISSDGPFSAFEGVDRIITLIQGPGVQLDAPDKGISHRLDRPMQSYFFPGEADIHCRLLGAPTLDFNVMVRRARARANLKNVQREMTANISPFGLIFVVSGHWKVSRPDVPVQQFHAGQGAWWHDATSERLEVVSEDADAAMLWLDIEH